MTAEDIKKSLGAEFVIGTNGPMLMFYEDGRPEGSPPFVGVALPVDFPGDDGFRCAVVFAHGSAAEWRKRAAQLERMAQALERKERAEDVEVDLEDVK